MSGYHPHPQTQYGNDYKASDDPRDHQNKLFTSDPSRNRAKDFSRDYPYERLPRYKPHDGPRLPVPSMQVGIPEGYWYTPAEIAAMSAENTQQPRRPAEGFEPFDRRSGEPTRTGPYVNSDYFQQPEHGYGQRRSEQYDQQPREQHDPQLREQHDLQPREHHDPHRRRQPRSMVKHYGSQGETFDYKSWSSTEEAQLVKWIEEGKSYSKIAKELGRTYHSVRGHWKRYFEGHDGYRGIEYNVR